MWESNSQSRFCLPRICSGNKNFDLMWFEHFRKDTWLPLNGEHVESNSFRNSSSFDRVVTERSIKSQLAKGKSSFQDLHQVAKRKCVGNLGDIVANILFFPSTQYKIYIFKFCRKTCVSTLINRKEFKHNGSFLYIVILCNKPQ